MISLPKYACNTSTLPYSVHPVKYPIKVVVKTKLFLPRTRLSLLPPTMAKGNSLRIDPFFPSAPDDFLTMPSSSKQLPSLTPSATSAILPYLRRLDIRDDIPSRLPKNPLLTLKLSTPSFLDSNVHDSLSDHPLYAIKTGTSSTTVLRYDPWEGPTNVADIRWPRQTPVKGKGKGKGDMHGVIIEMSGCRMKTADHFLKHTTLSG
jgi:hypothetical protein